MTYPRALAVAETAWTKKELKDWDDFSGRVRDLLPRMDFMKINYRKSLTELEQ